MRLQRDRILTTGLTVQFGIKTKVKVEIRPRPGHEGAEREKGFSYTFPKMKRGSKMYLKRGAGEEC
jgi:hypothetical protein